MENEKHIIRDFGDGLILRSATPTDMDALADFDSLMHSYDGSGDPEVRVGAWVRDLFSTKHPTFKVSDFLIVEHLPSQRIVSSSNLIPQQWAYEDVRFGVGRPELVGTHPNFRRRGLVAAQFEVLHQWSAERGHLLQAITGIPYYYRQFGYEMTVDYHGGRKAFLQKLPKLKDDESEACTFRPATEADIPFIIRLDEARQSRHLLRCVRGPEEWSYILNGVSDDSMEARAVRIIESRNGQAIGFLVHPRVRWHEGLFINRLELTQGASWHTVMPSVLRYLVAAGTKLPHYEGEGKDKPFEAVSLLLGAEHPAYEICEQWFVETLKPFAYYIRVPDLIAFLKHITPVLERRLAESLLAGYDGDLVLNFYRGGIKITFDAGKIISIESWPGFQPGPKGSAEFPDLTFYHVLFGYRSVDEVQHIYPDCSAFGTTRLLLNSLFPKRTSHIWPLS